MRLSSPRLLIPALGLLLAAAPWLAPRGWEALQQVANAQDPAALASHRLAALPAQAYASGIDQALAEGDRDLAQSLVALADQRGIALADDLRARALATAPVAERAVAVWRGFAHGEVESWDAAAGMLAADLVGYGDLRDLAREGRAWLAGEPVDALTAGLAATGLALTGALVVSATSVAPARLGVTTLKAAQRTGRLTAPLRRELAALGGGIFAGETRTTLAAIDTADRAAVRGLLRTERVATLGRTASEFGTAARALGPRGTLKALSLAESTRDVSRLSKLAAGFGRGTYAVLSLLGGAALTLGSAALSLAGWLVAALVWLLTTLRLLARLVAWLLPPWRWVRC